MSKIAVVAKSEFLRAVGSKAFLIGIVLMPIFFGGSLIAMAIAEATTDTSDRHFVVVDHTGRLWPLIEAACARRNANDVFERPATPASAGDDAAGLGAEGRPDAGGAPGKQTEPRWIPRRYEPPPGEQRSPEVALSDEVKESDLLGFLVVGADVFLPAGGADRMLAWHTDTPTYQDLSRWLESLIHAEIRRARLTEAGFDPGQVASLTRQDGLRVLGLASIDETGAVVQAEEEEVIANVVVPLALAMFLFMLVMMNTPALMNNVLEEKMQRIAEVLVSSVSPFELLLGKLLSAALVALTLAVLYVGAALVLVHFVEQIPPQAAAALDAPTLGWFLFFLLMALLIYGSLFGALGAACSELQDAQTLMGPAMLVTMFPLFFLVVLIENPDGTLARALSYFPTATPVLMFMRITMPPGVPLWEIGLAVLVTLLFSLLCVAAAGKIFRIGILSQGQAPTYRRLISWLLAR